MMVIALRSLIFFFRFVRNPSTKLNFQFEAFLLRNEIFKSNRSLPTMKIVSRSSDVKTKKRLFTQPPRKLLRVPNVGERGEGGRQPLLHYFLRRHHHRRHRPLPPRTNPGGVGQFFRPRDDRERAQVVRPRHLPKAAVERASEPTDADGREKSLFFHVRTWKVSVRPIDRSFDLQGCSAGSASLPEMKRNLF